MTLLPVQVIWTNYLSPDYSLFIALAILEREKMALFQPTNDFSDILEVRREGVGERKGGREGGRGEWLGSGVRELSQPGRFLW